MSDVRRHEELNRAFQCCHGTEVPLFIDDDVFVMRRDDSGRGFRGNLPDFTYLILPICALVFIGVERNKPHALAFLRKRADARPAPHPRFRNN